MSKSKNFIFHEDELIKIICGYFKQFKARKKKAKLLNGNELITFLNIKAGPLVGSILKQIEEAQALKEIKNKEQAVTLAKSVYKMMRQ